MAMHTINPLLTFLRFNMIMKKTIDNVVHIMKSFYWTQLKFLLLLSGIIMVAMGIFSFWHSITIQKTWNLFYSHMFSGTLTNDILLWLIIDVIPFAMVYKQISMEKTTNTLGAITTAITLFTGIFMGFDIVWIGYFWKKYIVNMLIIGVRLIVPMLLLSKINCTNGCNNSGSCDTTVKPDNGTKKVPIKKPSSSVRKVTNNKKPPMKNTKGTPIPKV